MNTNHPTNTDRIEKRILLQAPLACVWSAISDAGQFGRWFGVAFDGPFVSGSRLTGKIVPTTVDEEVARLQKPHEGKSFEIWVVRIEPMRLFSFHWHPYAIDPAADYSKEPATLVTFELQQQAGGVLLTLTESGFDRIPLERRAPAFTANDGGWTHQCRLIEKYLSVHS